MNINSYEWDELDFLFNRAKLRKIDIDTSIRERVLLISELRNIFLSNNINFYLDEPTNNLDEKSEIYNLNSEINNNYDAEYLSKKFIELWDSKISIEIEKNEEFKEVDILIINSSKAKDKLGWKPILSIDEMINETVLWEKQYLNDTSPDFSLNQASNYLNNLN